MVVLPPHHLPFADLYRGRGDWITGPAPDALAAHAAATPDKVALIDRLGPMRYAELDDAADRFATALIARGLGKGDRVAIQLPNWREFVIAQQGALRIGAAYVPLLPQLRDADVAFAVEASCARAIVVPGLFKGFDHTAMAQRLSIENIFVVGGSFEAALADAPATDFSAFVPDADDLRIVMFTSGTESKPKGVLHSYNTQYFGLKHHVGYFGLGKDDVVMCVSPVGHGTGAVNGVEFALHLGGTVVMLEAWQPETGLQAIADSGATMMWGATTFYNDLVGVAEGLQLPLPAFRYAFTAGAPVPRGLVGAVRQWLGAQLVTAYGQSEGQNIAITRPDDAPEQIASTDGRIHDVIDWKLVDADRRGAPPGTEGEFAYRGPNVCLGYLDPAHTAAAFDLEGYVYSGDLAVVDANRSMRIVGRRKDIIIRGGENISPAEIEDLLFDHPMIARVSVIGYPDERFGQRACAVIIPTPGERPGLAELIDHLAARRVAKFKYPERVVLVDTMPMTASGKVRKEVLRQDIFGAGK